jgi:hypothetical protein
LRNLLQARRDVDAVSQEIAALRDQHVADMDAYANAAPVDAAPQQFRRGERAGRAGKFEHEAVAGGVEDASALRARDLIERRTQARDAGGRLSLVGLAQGGIAHEIDRHDRRQLAVAQFLAHALLSGAGSSRTVGRLHPAMMSSRGPESTIFMRSGG